MFLDSIFGPDLLRWLIFSSRSSSVITSKDELLYLFILRIMKYASCEFD